MKILIAGGRSSLAQALRPVLMSFAEVLTAGRKGCDLELDLTWPAERFSLPTGLDCVINIAAHFGGKDFKAILEAEEVNALGALKLSHACTRASVTHFVQISSIFAGLDEFSPFYNSYALSKCHAEDLVRLYCRNVGLPLTILRPAQIYGVGESFRRHQPFIYSIMDQAQRCEDIVLDGSNDAQRNLIHVDDVVEIIARVARQRIDGHFECASLSNVRFSQIAMAAVAAFHSTSAICFDAKRPDIPDNAFALNDELYRLIKYYPRISLTEGMQREAAHRKSLT